MRRSTLLYFHDWKGRGGEPCAECDGARSGSGPHRLDRDRVLDTNTASAAGHAVGRVERAYYRAVAQVDEYVSETLHTVDRKGALDSIRQYRRHGSDAGVDLRSGHAGTVDRQVADTLPLHARQDCVFVGQALPPVHSGGFAAACFSEETECRHRVRTNRTR